MHGNKKNLVIGYKVFSDAQTGGTANICFFFPLTNLYNIIPEGQIYLQAETSCWSQKWFYALFCRKVLIYTFIAKHEPPTKINLIWNIFAQQNLLSGKFLLFLPRV